MRMSHMALAELNEALNRGWSDRDSRIGMLLQVERSGIEPLAVARPGSRACLIRTDNRLSRAGRRR